MKQKFDSVEERIIRSLIGLDLEINKLKQMRADKALYRIAEKSGSR
jgi:hypothetical protein